MSFPAGLESGTWTLALPAACPQLSNWCWRKQAPDRLELRQGDVSGSQVQSWSTPSTQACDGDAWAELGDTTTQRPRPMSVWPGQRLSLCTTVRQLVLELRRPRTCFFGTSSLPTRLSPVSSGHRVSSLPGGSGREAWTSYPRLGQGRLAEQLSVGLGANPLCTRVQTCCTGFASSLDVGMKEGRQDEP